MNYLNISDDFINHKSSKWFLEELILQGCDGFSFKPTNAISASQLEFLKTHFVGAFFLETSYFQEHDSPWHGTMFLYKFNRDSVRFILSNMGRHLLDFHAELGNWQFYKDQNLIAGANKDDDFVTVNEPSNTLIEHLQQMEIPFELKST